MNENWVKIGCIQIGWKLVVSRLGEKIPFRSSLLSTHVSGRLNPRRPTEQTIRRKTQWANIFIGWHLQISFKIPFNTHIINVYQSNPGKRPSSPSLMWSLFNLKSEGLSWLQSRSLATSFQDWSSTAGDRGRRKRRSRGWKTLKGEIFEEEKDRSRWL